MWCGGVRIWTCPQGLHCLAWCLCLLGGPWGRLSTGTVLWHRSSHFTHPVLFSFSPFLDYTATYFFQSFWINIYSLPTLGENNSHKSSRWRPMQSMHHSECRAEDGMSLPQYWQDDGFSTVCAPAMLRLWRPSLCWAEEGAPSLWGRNLEFSEVVKM